MLKNWYDFHSFIFRGGYFPEIACKYKYLTAQPFFALKKCFCTKSSSLVNKKYIGDSFKHLSICSEFRPRYVIFAILDASKTSSTLRETLFLCGLNKLQLLKEIPHWSQEILPNSSQMTHLRGFRIF